MFGPPCVGLQRLPERVVERPARADTGRQGRTPAVCGRDPAAHSLSAAVVQPVGPNHGRGAVRHADVSRVRGTGCRRGQPARREHHPAVSSPARSPQPQPSDPGRRQRHTGGQGPAAQERHGGRCHADRSTEFDQELQRPARPRDASDQAGQPVALRHEGTHRVDADSGLWCTRWRARRPRSTT